MAKLKWHNETRKIDELLPFESNPRQLTDKQAEDLKKSLDKFDLVEIPAIDLDNRIIAGHQRVKVLQLLGRGHEEIDVRVPNRKLTASEFKEYNIRSNKNTGQWDFNILSSSFSLTDLVDWGFNAEDIEDYFITDEERDNRVPPLPEKAITKKGDIYELGNHRLICGDSKDYSTFEKLMGGGEANLCFTSPPYNMAADLYKTYTDDLKSEEYINFNLEIIKNVQAFLKGFIFWNISYNKNARQEFIEIIYKIIKETGLKFLELIVWDKGHGMPIVSRDMLTRQYEDILLVGNEEESARDLELYFCGSNREAYFNKKTSRGITNYWRIGTNDSQREDLKACFPVALPLKGVLLMSTIGDIVLDPFLGSGSTMIACEKSERKCYGIELDPKYCDVIVKRWEEYTGRKAVKNGNKD